MFEFKAAYCAALNLKLLQNGAYLNLPNEEWAVKIMTNLLVNQGVYESLDAQKREDLIQGQAAYVLNSLAAKLGESPEAQQAKQELERHIQILKNIISEGGEASTTTHNNEEEKE